MPWTYKINQALEMVEVSYIGTVTAKDLHESTSELIGLQKEKGFLKYLVDTTEMEIEASYSDIYDIPGKQYIEEGADRNGRVAVILSTDPVQKDAAQFYELMCQIMWWKARAFPERQEAVNWLTRDISNMRDGS